MRVATGAVLILCSLALGTKSADAQAPDTLRYREVTDQEMVLSAPQGDIPTTMEHDAVIGMLQIGPDSAHAWYETLSVAATSPNGEQRPDLASVAGDLFILRFDPKGHVEALRTPDFPPELESLTDLRYQFADFFMPRPGPDLRIGLTWSDTLVMDLDRAEGMSGENVNVVSYTVVSDTLLGSTEAFVIDGRGDITVRNEGPIEGRPGLTMRMTLAGPEQNRFYVAKEGGRLLLRLRSAELAGTLVYAGGAQPMELGIDRTYTNRIELLK